MENCITYFLRDKSKNSNEYYRFISNFSNEVIEKIEIEANNIIENFINFIKNNSIEELRSREEYELEFLIIGVLWKTYIAKALNADRLSLNLLKLLFNLRTKSKFLRKSVDNLRGRLACKYLLKKEVEPSSVSYDESDFEKLLLWLTASGEFKYECKRMNTWLLFLKNSSEEYIIKVSKCAFKISLWFEKRSMEVLGVYTPNVQKFLNTNYRLYGIREDNVFCGRKEVEYHLNMVGAEILSKAFRKLFVKTKERKVLLPACICLKPEGVCKRKRVKDGFLCRNCSKSCRVNELTKLGKSHNFQVLIVPHETDAFSNAKNIRYGDVGVVGVACVLNLIEGGLKARSLNLVPQCVILDYCGCKNHWDNNGIQTDINCKKLFEILQVDENM